VSAKLFRRQGFSGTSVAEITTEVDTALSSLYYFFPQGKEQLCEEALRRSGAAFGEFIEGALDSSSSWTRAVHNLFTQAAEWLVETDFVEGSPIATVALEVASSNEALRLVAAEIYGDWLSRITQPLLDDGVPKVKARKLAVHLLSLLEGALLLCRVQRNTEALDVARVRAAEAVAEVFH
jgi:AcrR family transcriptional regulator